MMINSDPMITSTSNHFVKLARSLRNRKNRDENKLFLVEGIHNVGAAIEAGWKIQSILYSSELLKSTFANQLIEQQLSAGNCYSISSQLFDSISEKDNPQGLLAIIHQQDIKLDELDPLSIRWGVAALSPQDPGNVGTLLRTIDSAGADGLFLLDGGVDPYHPAGVRASMGSLFFKPVISASFHGFTKWAETHHYTLVGTSAHAKQDYHVLSTLPRPVILLLGNEQKGMDPEQMQVCDLVVSLPMHGHASSLNISVAAGILLYAML